MTMHPWIEELSPQLEYIVAGTPDQYIARLLQKVDLSEEKVNPYLFGAYHLGREFNDQQVMERSSKILQSRIPRLEQRMPFYEAMFDIMDKARFTAEEGLTRYKLDEQLHQQLSRKLSEKTGMRENSAKLYIQQFSRDLAFAPGVQFTRQADDPSLPRHARVGLIADYLHRPLREVMTVPEERSAAAVHYDSLLEDCDTQLEDYDTQLED